LRPLRASREASKHNTAPTSPAQPCHEALEARPCHHPAGRTAEIVVDHLDVAEPSASRLLDELILPSLVFQVALDLPRG
jgi:hypothetical protein